MVKRNITATSIAIIFMFLVIKAADKYSHLDEGMRILRLDTETARFASKQIFDKFTAIGQLTLALLGATWALLIIQKTEVRVSDIATRTCFLATNLSFVTSFAIYSYGYDFLVNRIFYHAAFDIDAPIVRFFQFEQQLFFAFGCITLATTLLLGRKNS